jgi:hypothetical protein
MDSPAYTPHLAHDILTVIDISAKVAGVMATSDRQIRTRRRTLWTLE